jgi:hypothetical protein
VSTAAGGFGSKWILLVPGTNPAFAWRIGDARRKISTGSVKFEAKHPEIDQIRFKSIGYRIISSPNSDFALGMPRFRLADAQIQLRSKKLIERFLLAILPEPQRLARLQVADHGDELHLLAEVNLIHTHLC